MLLSSYSNYQSGLVSYIYITPYDLQVLVASHTLTSCCILYSHKSGLTKNIILSLLWRVPMCALVLLSH